MENYSYISNINDLKALKRELAELLEEADNLRCLPLYSCRITDWKFVCSKSHDKVYAFV